MGSWRSLPETLETFASACYDRLDEPSRRDVAVILNAAAELARGERGLVEFARLGSIPAPSTGVASSGYSRYLALLSASPDDPRRRDLLAAIDAVLRFQGLILTTAGVWSPADIAANGMVLHPAPLTFVPRKESVA